MMDFLQKIPVSLKIVAGYFLFRGFSLLMLAIFRAFENESFNPISFLVPGILIMFSYKLVILQPRWRTLALFSILPGILLVAGSIFIQISGISSIFSDQTQEFFFNSNALSLVGKGLIVIFLYWQYRVLTRADIMKLFELGDLQNTGPDDPHSVDSKDHRES